ncbi:hypothetical protein B0J14DRAFT_220430 [Halenospora varia]|nr:hypothetical protein B0J14DRAFT_220430 [Halenospora varia]
MVDELPEARARIKQLEDEAKALKEEIKTLKNDLKPCPQKASTVEKNVTNAKFNQTHLLGELRTLHTALTQPECSDEQRANAIDSISSILIVNDSFDLANDALDKAYQDRITNERKRVAFHRARARSLRTELIRAHVFIAQVHEFIASWKAKDDVAIDDARQLVGALFAGMADAAREMNAIAQDIPLPLAEVDPNDYDDLDDLELDTRRVEVPKTGREIDELLAGIKDASERLKRVAKATETTNLSLTVDAAQAAKEQKEKEGRERLIRQYTVRNVKLVNENEGLTRNIKNLTAYNNHLREENDRLQGQPGAATAGGSSSQITQLTAENANLKKEIEKNTQHINEAKTKIEKLRKKRDEAEKSVKAGQKRLQQWIDRNKRERADCADEKKRLSDELDELKRLFADLETVVQTGEGLDKETIQGYLTRLEQMDLNSTAEIARLRRLVEDLQGAINGANRVPDQFNPILKAVRTIWARFEELYNMIREKKHEIPDAQERGSVLDLIQNIEVVRDLVTEITRGESADEYDRLVIDLGEIRDRVTGLSNLVNVNTEVDILRVRQQLRELGDFINRASYPQLDIEGPPEPTSRRIISALRDEIAVLKLYKTELADYLDRYPPNLRNPAMVKEVKDLIEHFETLGEAYPEDNCAEKLAHLKSQYRVLTDECERLQDELDLDGGRADELEATLANEEDVAMNAEDKARDERYRLNAEIRDLQEQLKKSRKGQNTELLECLEHRKKFEAQLRGLVMLVAILKSSMRGLRNLVSEEQSTTWKELKERFNVEAMEEDVYALTGVEEEISLDFDGVKIIRNTIRDIQLVETVLRGMKVNGQFGTRRSDSTASERLTNQELTRHLEELQRQFHIDEEGIPVVIQEELERLRQQLKDVEEKCKEEKKKLKDEKDEATKRLQEATDQFMNRYRAQERALLNAFAELEGITFQAFLAKWAAFTPAEHRAHQGDENALRRALRSAGAELRAFRTALRELAQNQRRASQGSRGSRGGNVNNDIDAEHPSGGNRLGDHIPLDDGPGIAADDFDIYSAQEEEPHNPAQNQPDPFNDIHQQEEDDNAPNIPEDHKQREERIRELTLENDNLQMAIYTHLGTIDRLQAQLVALNSESSHDEQIEELHDLINELNDLIAQLNEDLKNCREETWQARRKRILALTAKRPPRTPGGPRRPDQALAQYSDLSPKGYKKHAMKYPASIYKPRNDSLDSNKQRDEEDGKVKRRSKRQSTREQTSSAKKRQREEAVKSEERRAKRAATMSAKASAAASASAVESEGTPTPTPRKGPKGKKKAGRPPKKGKGRKEAAPKGKKGKKAAPQVEEEEEEEPEGPSTPIMISSDEVEEEELPDYESDMDF